MASLTLRALTRAAVLAATLAAAAPASAQTAVDLQLVLAVDVSRSMELAEQVIQRNGYADAIRSPEVIAAIKAGPLGRIGLTYVEWSNADLQRVLVGWTIIDGEAAADDFAARLRRWPITPWNATSISGGLRFAATLLEHSGFDSERQVIDISGDGPNNVGGPVEPARDEVVGQGIVVNGLPIMLARGRSDPRFGDLEAYYRSCVIGGEGAFVVPVNDVAQLAEAIRRKLVLEIADLSVTTINRAAQAQPSRLGERSAVDLVQLAAPVDCLIGEKLLPGR